MYSEADRATTVYSEADRATTVYSEADRATTVYSEADRATTVSEQQTAANKHSQKVRDSTLQMLQQGVATVTRKSSPTRRTDVRRYVCGVSK